MNNSSILERPNTLPIFSTQRELPYLAGVEYEAAVFSSGRVVNVSDEIGLEGIKNDYGSIKPEYGHNNIELITSPSSDTKTIFDNLIQLYQIACQVLDNCEIVYQNSHQPYIAGLDAITPNKRYLALAGAVKQEMENNGLQPKEIYHGCQFNAVHFTFGIDWQTPHGLKVFNALVDIGCLLAVVYAKPHPSWRLRNGWSDWSMPYRLPGPHKFETPELLYQKIMNIPQLIIEDDKDEYRTYLEKPVKWNALHEGTIWWHVRPKLASFKGIEVRYFDSMPIEDVEEVFNCLVKTIDKVLEGEKLPEFSSDQWWYLIKYQDIKYARSILQEFNLIASAA